MSILSFLGHLLQGFLKLFKGMEPAEKDAVQFSSAIIDALKQMDGSEENPVDTILALLPAELHQKFTEFGTDVLFKAGLIPSPMGPETLGSAIRLAAAKIKEIKGSLGHKVSLNNLGIFLTDVFADGKIGWDDLVHLPKLFFDNKAELSTDAAPAEEN